MDREVNLLKLNATQKRKAWANLKQRQPKLAQLLSEQIPAFVAAFGSLAAVWVPESCVSPCDLPEPATT